MAWVYQDREVGTFPNQGDRGTHVNVSGAAVLKSAPHPQNAVKLIEHLASAVVVAPGGDGPGRGYETRLYRLRLRLDDLGASAVAKRCSGQATNLVKL